MSVLEERFVGSIQPAPFQLEDIPRITERDWSANWSEMGAYKTSTVLWSIPRWCARAGIENPKVLIITTRSGKGTYFKHVPDLLPDYECLNLKTSSCSIVLDDLELPIDLPDLNNYEQPVICVAHYNVFSKRAKKKKKGPKDAPVEVELTEEEKDDQLLESIIEQYMGEQKAASAKKPLLPDLHKIKWDVIVLDEAHRIKGRTTGWTKEIKKLKGTIKHAMTGTGFINNPSEIWSIFNFLDRHMFGSYWRFREKYCLEEYDDSGFRRIVGVHPDNEDEFKALVRSVGPRRTKKEVFKDLPDPIFSPVTVDLSPIQRKMYDEIVAYLETLDQQNTPINSPNVLAALTRLRQVTAATPQVLNEWFDMEAQRVVQEITLVEPSSKLDAMMEVIEGLEWDDERRDQCVVFFNFKPTIELAKKRFEPKGISYIHLEQKDNDRVRYEKWALQFPKKEHQVFICTLQLGGESIDLTSASTCIFLDRSWSPKDNSQGESRVWRPPQKETPNIIHLNAKDTVDARVLAKVNKKQGWFNQIFG